jgi:putative transposase
MSRHTTFKFCLDPTVEQHGVLARHAGAARFAFNQCLHMVKTALTQRKSSPDVDVPWTGFDLINTFNAWKKTEDAGRVFTVDTDGTAETIVTGLAWRPEVCQQVFEEAAVDLGKALKGWSDSRSGKRKGKRVGFPPASRRNPSRRRRFGCATSTRMAGRRLSGSATMTGPGQSPCPASARSGCMTTPGGCGACSSKAEPRSCSPPFPITAAGGGSA